MSPMKITSTMELNMYVLFVPMVTIPSNMNARNAPGIVQTAQLVMFVLTVSLDSG